MDSLYSDESPGGTTAPDSGAQDQQGSDDSTQTALIPKSLLAGKDFKPGDTVTLKIVRFTNDEAEVAYASDEQSEEDAEKEPQEQEQPITPPMPQAGEESMYS